MPRVVIASRSAGPALRVVTVTGRDRLLVGRGGADSPDDMPDIDLHPDLRVSRRHARLARDVQGWQIEDLGSKCGTVVDGVDIVQPGSTELRPGVEVRTGDTTWVLIPDDWVLTCTGSVVVFGPVSQQVNYAAFHCGAPVIGTLRARNLGSAASPSSQLGLSIPDYSDSCEVTVPPLAPNTGALLGTPVFRLRGEALRQLAAPVRSRLRVLVDGAESPGSSLDIVLLGLWDWNHARDARRTIAAFVSPHDPIVVELSRDTTARLSETAGVASIDALLASGRRDAERSVLEAVYRCLAEQRDVHWGPPQVKACFDGGPLYQRITPPDRLLRPRASPGKATCLDLAVLMASCLERLGLLPVILFVEGRDHDPRHAIVGCWAGPAPGPNAVTCDAEFLRGEVDSGNLFVCECTGVADRGRDAPKLSFGEATAAAVREMHEAQALSAVDVGALRPPHGMITPMAYALEPEVALACDHAIDFAREKHRETIETAFLLYGLIAGGGSLTSAVTQALGVRPKEALRLLRDGVSRREHAAEPRPTWNYLECRRLAEAYAWHAEYRSVREQDVWWALLDRGVHSNSLRSAARLSGIDLAQLRAVLARICPRPQGATEDPVASQLWSGVRPDQS